MNHALAAPLVATPGVSTPAPPPASPAEGRACAPRAAVFLDIEASSLAPHSWPVEVGWAWVAGGRVESRGAVVAPRPSWTASAWSEASARCHGLSFERVQAGMPADTVAEATDALADRHVVSDNAGWDQLWLDRLREGRPRILVHPLRALIADDLAPEAASAFVLELLRSRAPHRAAGDAARLAHAWAVATRA